MQPRPKYFPTPENKRFGRGCKPRPAVACDGKSRVSPPFAEKKMYKKLLLRYLETLDG
ncbi:Uncharacterized protein dnm_040380 [Desulfonema magnum]|uniref:Uncharacterized protein n=1 Tax=Desulfonema magnum TaxID=45655 RepID=A0A975BM43_9BACT|nr:Uncharacterized protein dnm_040380 [Desulfonema magnum]